MISADVASLLEFQRDSFKPALVLYIEFEKGQIEVINVYSSLGHHAGITGIQLTPVLRASREILITPLRCYSNVVYKRVATLSEWLPFYDTTRQNHFENNNYRFKSNKL